ncbi:PTS fructose transporter subunit IIA [Parasulfuritortus cantonensis]|uniref:PTS fructose transporter subunit IIA n=1 Tax=Parasulfuritortus cantonensis TaxID=2528202 RepID=A0A4R1BIQ7_9PROT|nr:PTS fructose transporter subunit IIA [Parasulfuritortus cantonensis]TCJ17159.1 PTS fructose transporter subunit IIA [Parasulfuritortus cantonensis]
MIGLLIVAHGSLGESLIQCATYVLGQRPERLQALDLMAYPDADAMLAVAKEHIEALAAGNDGVLVLTDVYGATPCNTVCKLLRPGRVEGVAGVNLPMLLKVLNYRNEPLNLLADRAANGGQAGVMHIRFEHCDA